MMTITKIGGGNAARYYTTNGFAGYLLSESVKGEADGHWYFGQAVSDFGLDANQPPTMEQMSRLLAGYDANSGESLIKGAGQENRIRHSILHYHHPSLFPRC